MKAPRISNAARLCVALLLAWARAARPAPPPVEPAAFQRVPVPDESPAHLCSALAQDRDGFLWIGTQGGLVRYDGYQFRSFKSEPDDPKTLAGSYVRTLFPSSDGRLWVGTFSSGLSVYDPATETFARYQHDPRNPASLSHDRIEAVAEDRSGRIWVGTYEGLDRIDPKGLTHFRHDPRDPRSVSDDRIRALLVDRAGQLWVGSHEGLQVWRGEGRGFERIASEPGAPGSLAGQFVAKLFEDAQGRIWIGTTENGAAVFDPRTGRFDRLTPKPTPDGLSHFWVYGFAQPAPNEVWIATFGGGIDVVDPDSLQVVERLRHDPALESTVGGDRIGALLRDRSGVVWVGTWGQGLARYDPAARAFRTLRHSPNLPDGLTYPEAVRSLQMRDGSIWVGTNGNGVDVFDRQWRRTGGHRPDPKNPGTLADGSVTCLAQAADGTIWVATLNGVLHRLRPGAQGFERFSEADGLPGGPIRTMIFGPDGDLWVGAAEGMARISALPAAPRPRIVSFRHRLEDPASLSGQAVEALAFDAAGTLWVGTDSGLNAFDPTSGTAVRILQTGRRDGLPANWVPDLMVAADGRLWVATQSGACVLASWDGHDGRSARFESVADRMGRPPAPVDALIQDAQGWVWLGGRLRVNPKTWQWQELGPADGAEIRNFFIASRARTAAGELLFGAPAGLMIVRPDRIAPWTYAPPLVATSLRVDGVERPGGAAPLTLKAQEKGFRLDFAALDFTAPAKNLYRYRLVGYDEKWLPADAAHRSLAYNNLPPGHYTLQVQGTNRAGQWSPHEIRLPVTVRPAFYQTAWFRALAALLMVALAYGLYRLRVRRLEARSRTLERLVQERTLELGESNRELASAYARIEEASLTDPLTGLRNRRFLEQALASDAEIAVRRHEDGKTAAGDADLVFLILDLDHFKSVNDTYGHAAGDAVLTQTAALLRATVRSSDHVVRWGGEEFLVVARFFDRRDAPALAEKIRAAIASHEFRLDDGTTLARTGSFGFAAYPFFQAKPREITWQDVVAVADVGLYAAKRSGRNRWVGVEARETGDPQASVQRFRQDPRAAVETGEMLVHAADGEGSSVEWT